MTVCNGRSTFNNVFGVFSFCYLRIANIEIYTGTTWDNHECHAHAKISGLYVIKKRWFRGLPSHAHTKISDACTIKKNVT